MFSYMLIVHNLMLYLISLNFSRSVILLIVVVVISYIIYLVCKGHQKLTYQKWLLRVSPIVSPKRDVETESQINSKNGENSRQKSLNTQKYNPEVCEMKIYIIITLIFVAICSAFVHCTCLDLKATFSPFFNFLQDSCFR